MGGDRPRIVVTLDYATLLADASAAGLIGDGEPLSAGDLRRLCCDADLLPAVLGGPGTVLDVGRDSRLVPADLRAALVLRDGGCAFPGCGARPSECEAHHVIPWWQGGITALPNLALLCHHHHGLVEPARYGVRDQWEIRIATDGLPEAIPPRRCDPDRRPLRHARHHTGQDPGDASPPGAGPMDELEQTG
ncbi:HNH endonuclease [Propionicimonas sp.]|uniref:HNH endonuclease n=1 Tax=Propionicimonas sp. TaxID=1955623 RepID=UPI0039C97758